MMRQITIDAIRAFRNGNKFKRANTEVEVYPHSNFRRLKLHGNTIAELGEDGLFITSAGWSTVTTKERLNGLPNVNIIQRNYQWFLNGEEWNGDWIKI